MMTGQDWLEEVLAGRERLKNEYLKFKVTKTRLPGAVPQPIGLFLFCIEFGWG